MTVAPNNRDTLAPRRSAADSRDVLRPRSRTVTDQPDRPVRPGGGGAPPRINWPLELARMFFSVLGLLVALVTVIACLGMAYVSYKMMDVLGDISQRDFSSASQRFERYANRFENMKQQRCRIEHSDPKINEGITYYLWIVQPPGSEDRIIYRWKHMLSTNTVEPMTNPALLLDIELSYVKGSDAAGYSFYDPNDKLATALARQQFNLVGPEQLGRRANGAGLPSGPVLPPVIAPDQARSRVHTEPAVDPNAPPADATDDTPPGDATDVGGDTAADNGSGDASDITKPKDEPKDKDVPPPDNDAVPVE